MQNAMSTWFRLTWFSVVRVFILNALVLSHLGCAFNSEGTNSRPMEIGQTTFEDFPRRADENLSITLAAHEEDNWPRIIVAEEYNCFAAYNVVNAGNHPRYVRNVRFTVQPIKAFSHVRLSWADQASTLGYSGKLDTRNEITVTFPSMENGIKPQAVRTLRICGITHSLTPTADRSSAKPTSGESVFVALQTLHDSQGKLAKVVGSLDGVTHVLRKTVPTVDIGLKNASPPALGSPTLFAWNVAAHANKQLSIKQFGLHLELTDVTVCNLRLLRNGLLTPLHAVDIRAVSGNRQVSSSLLSSCFETTTDVAVLFQAEHVLWPKQKTFFAVRGEVRRLSSGARISTSFLRTKELTTTSLGCGQQGFVVTAGNHTYLPGLLWSDYSDEPHSHKPCHSSRDWIGDALVENLGNSWIFDTPR